MRSHTPGVDGWLDWRAIDDLYAVYAALRSHSSWSSLPAWVESSSTCRAFEAGGQQIFAGMHLEDFTDPSSIIAVFDYECQGYKYGTYTIFCGSDYQIAVPDQPLVDKSACIVEAVKAHMASRAGCSHSQSGVDITSESKLNSRMSSSRCMVRAPESVPRASRAAA